MIPLATALSAIAATAWVDDWVITAACLICGMVAKTVVETWRME